MNIKKKSLIIIKNKQELALWGILLLAGFVFMGMFLLFSKQGKYVEVSVDGSVVSRYEINKNNTYIIEGYNGGTNVIQIENGKVFINQADCPDKLCQHQGKIERVGQSIICLPHRLVVSIVSNQDKTIDGVAE